MDAIRAQLDELMGKDRNLTLNEKTKIKEHYDDPDVCKYALVSICPHDLFPNTKCDLGVCPKKHDEYFKKMFLSDENRINYERRYINETLGLIESMIENIDVKIKKAQMKLNMNYSEFTQPKEVLEKIELIDLEIKGLLSQVERLGEEGKIEEVEAITTQIEMLRSKKEELKLAGDQNVQNGMKPMKVCEICGALQTVNDIDKRTQTHLEGKLHTGFALIRKEAENLRARKEELRNLSVFAKLSKLETTEKSQEKVKKPSSTRSRSRSKTHDKSKERIKDRKKREDSKNRKKNHRSTRKENSNSPHDSKSRSRSRSRNKNKKYRDRERDRERERDRDKRSRSKDTRYKQDKHYKTNGT